MRRKNWQKLREKFTVMVVPHSKKSVASFRFSLLSFYILLAVLAALALTGAVLTYTYQRMRLNMAELHYLRRVNEEQRAQIEELVAETKAIEGSMARIEELDRQLRQIMKLEQKTDTKVADKDARNVAQDDGKASGGGQLLALRVLQASSPASRGQKTDELAELRSKVETLKQEIDQEEADLTELKAKAISYMAYQEAKPSGMPARGRITSRYGSRRSPFGSGVEFHTGIDIAASYGTPIVATGSGKVVSAGWFGSYGWTVVINHGYGFETMYGHASRLVVRSGQTVKRGQVIAYMGSSGRSTGSHVHYEVHLSGRKVDPYPYL